MQVLACVVLRANSGVNLVSVQGSGPKQRIIKEDIQAFVKSQLSQLQTGSDADGLPAAPVGRFF